MSFYLRLTVAVKDHEGLRKKRGDIIGIHPFDVWGDRKLGGRKVRRNSLIMFLQLPNAARDKVLNKLTSMQYLYGGWYHITNAGGDVDIEDTVLAKRRLSIPVQMFQTRFPGLYASVDWQRVRDEDDEYQPWANGDDNDRLFVLTANQASFIYDKLRGDYITQNNFDLEFK